MATLICMIVPPSIKKKPTSYSRLQAVLLKEFLSGVPMAELLQLAQPSLVALHLDHDGGEEGREPNPEPPLWALGCHFSHLPIFFSYKVYWAKCVWFLSPLPQTMILSYLLRVLC